MSNLFTNPQFEEDLHLLMSIGLLAVEKGVETKVSTIYDIWILCYPDDAMGCVGVASKLFQIGNYFGAYHFLKDNVDRFATRKEKAEEVLAKFEKAVPALLED